jgi:hypothetical protein
MIFFIGGLNWEEKIALTKRQKQIKRIRIELKNIIYHNFRLKGEIKNQ